MKKRRNLTRALALLLTLVMLLCVAGCSKEENTTGKVEGSQSTGNKDTSGGDSSTTAPVEPTEPELYILTGVWKFNDELINPVPEDERADYNGSFEQEIDFVTNGIVCYKIHWSYFGVYDWQDITFYHKRDIGGLILLYMDEKSYDKWERDYMELDFGDVPQEVSEEFYHWFTANATKQ